MDLTEKTIIDKIEILENNLFTIKKIKKMKAIQPITIWKNGESQEANLLNAYIINDNLQSSCSFYYQLSASGEGTEAYPLVIGQTLAEGNVTMDGENYSLWNGDNNDAYSYIAAELNLTLIETT
jgi:hypothetical protein